MAEAAAGDMVVANFGDRRGFTGCHSAERAVLQRLGPPGALPVKPGPPASASRRRVSSALSVAAIDEVKPTWLSLL